MRRRRRTRYQWFFPTGSAGPTANVDDDTSGREMVLSVPADGTSVATIIAMVLDVPGEFILGLTDNTLSQLQSNEYVLKRVVGKCFVSVNQQGAPSTPALLIGAGIFVARAEDANASPIGSATAAELVRNYSPLRTANNVEPWVWRRTWILSNRLQNLTDTAGEDKFPETNAGYGSIQDGPHIDAKTGRRVGNDDRLFFVLAARNYPLNAVTTGAQGVRAYVDYRVLGAMRRSRGKSAF